ncbi:conserved hypothetical protein [Hyella patelloides LEGE 07179]|uniref:LRAT domain-containing protein n=1 Tax=Hyella patelloides LEGE 07179 TaxID=945734 RepID=A0A563W5I5_9CYAN|nr:hypothetical protein [Hyella patelloides]VEP18803.1 conserved hypothetical protein [Hyella patelloides LEGE 07179]
MLSENEIVRLRNEIKAKANSNSKMYGKLLEWQESFANHYAIGLSDEYMFSPGGVFSVIKISEYNLKSTPTKTLPSNLVIQRLIYALDCFKTWEYGLLGWNCEHYSRLVATNEAFSYQVKFSPLAFLNNGGYHPDAVNIFQKYLKKKGLKELIRNP